MWNCCRAADGPGAGHAPCGLPGGLERHPDRTTRTAHTGRSCRTRESLPADRELVSIMLDLVQQGGVPRLVESHGQTLRVVLIIGKRRTRRAFRMSSIATRSALHCASA